MTRIMKIILTVDEDKVGSIIADLSGRVTSMAFETVELVDRRSRIVPENSGRGGARISHPDGSIEERAKKYLTSTPEIIALGAKAHDVAEGIDAKYQSVYAALGKLKSNGLVTKDGTGRWFIVKDKSID